MKVLPDSDFKIFNPQVSARKRYKFSARKYFQIIVQYFLSRIWSHTSWTMLYRLCCIVFALSSGFSDIETRICIANSQRSNQTCFMMVNYHTIVTHLAIQQIIQWKSDYPDWRMDFHQIGWVTASRKPFQNFGSRFYRENFSCNKQLIGFCLID